MKISTAGKPKGALWATALVALLAVAWGAQHQDARAASQKDDSKVAKVGDLVVERSELLDMAGAQLESVELEQLQCESNAAKKRYEVLAFNLDRLIKDRLAELGARDKSMSKEDFLAKEHEAREALVDDQRIDQFIAANQRLAQAPREQIAPQIRTFLAESELFDELEDKYEVKRQLDPYRVQVASTGVAKGGAKASVEIVEFSDFQCPYCKQVTPILDGVVEKYGDKVKLVFRQFPLESIHPNAFKSAEASLCANEQGKFWQMHDLMFEEQRELGVEQLKEKAVRLGVDAKKFNECLDSGRHAEKVRTDIREGALAGVTGTPALFINGRPYSGNRTVEAISEVVDEEIGSGS